jgi:hypothetical protein
LTQSAVDLMQLVGKYMFSGGASLPLARHPPRLPLPLPPRKPLHEAQPDRRPRIAAGLIRQALAASALAVALAAAAPSIVHCAGRRQAGRRRAPRRASRASSCSTNATRIVPRSKSAATSSPRNRAALDKFVSTEFNQMFDRDYAGRLVLGRHGRGASDADVKLFSDALADSLMSRYGSALLPSTRA